MEFNLDKTSVLEHYPNHKIQVFYPIITSTISALTAIAAIFISLFKP